MAAKIRKLRVDKRSLALLVGRRIRAAGEDSVPAEHEWVTGWEAHQPNVLSPPQWPWASPWDQFVFQFQDPRARPAVTVEAEAPTPTPTDLVAVDRSLEFWRHPGASSPCGAYIQSDHGIIGDFQIVVVQHGRIVHYRRPNDDAFVSWVRTGELPGGASPNRRHEDAPMPGGIQPGGASRHEHARMPDGNRPAGSSEHARMPGGGEDLADRMHEIGTARAPSEPTSASMFQGSIRSGNQPHGDLEVVSRQVSAGLDYLATFRYTDGEWHGPLAIEVDGARITGVTGAPIMLQSDWGQNGDFDLLVPIGDRVVHFRRDNDASGRPWRRAGEIQFSPGGSSPGGPDAGVGYAPIAVALMQSNFLGVSAPPLPHGRLEAVIHMHSQAFSEADYLAACSYDNDAQRWGTPMPIVADGEMIRGVVGQPTLIQTDTNNYEMIVIQERRLVHYWRDNNGPQPTPWHRGDTLPGPGDDFFPTSVSLFSSNYRDDKDLGELELLVRMASDRGEDYLATYTVSFGTPRWHGPTAIMIEGQRISGVADF